MTVSHKTPQWDSFANPSVWSALALPTLLTVKNRLRRGAVVLIDNTISGAAGYEVLLSYLRDTSNGFVQMTLPFTNGFEMCTYLPEMERQR